MHMEYNHMKLCKNRWGIGKSIRRKFTQILISDGIRQRVRLMTIFFSSFISTWEIFFDNVITLLS